MVAACKKTRITRLIVVCPPHLRHTDGITHIFVDSIKQGNGNIPGILAAVDRADIQSIRTTSTLTHRTKHKHAFLSVHIRLTHDKAAVYAVSMRRMVAIAAVCKIFQGFGQI